MRTFDEDGARVYETRYSRARATGESGAAVAEFVMVVALLTAVFISVLQLALVLHVRNTLMDAAAAGARYGALADRTADDGAQRARSIVSESLSPSFAKNVSAHSFRVADAQGVRIVIETGFPLMGFLPVAGDLTVSGEALGYD